MFGIPRFTDTATRPDTSECNLFYVRDPCPTTIPRREADRALQGGWATKASRPTRFRTGGQDDRLAAPISYRPDLYPDARRNLVPGSARMKQVIANVPAWSSSTGSGTHLARTERDMSSCTRRFGGRPDPARSRTMQYFLFPAVAPAAVWLATLTSVQRSLATVPAFNPDRAYGRWHKIAWLPNRFQAKCVSDTQAG